MTRFCLDRRINAATRRFARDRLVAAIADFGLEQGIDLFTGVAEQGWLQQILTLGWVCKPLGLPRRIDGRTLGALAITIDQETPSLLARAGRGAAMAQKQAAHHAA